MDAPVKFVIILYYHGFYSWVLPAPSEIYVRDTAGPALPSRRPSGRPSHPHGPPPDGIRDCALNAKQRLKALASHLGQYYYSDGLFDVPGLGEDLAGDDEVS